ncbi:MAG TPA: TolC family protein [Flavobacteriaceae bacterium]|nr:TolC family protein [Flavobacteriaceae bacterium]
MNTIFKTFLVAFFISLVAQASSIQTMDTLKLDVTSYERLFLEKNLSILAQQLSVAQEEALLIQEKVWNNPEVSISDANLWTPSNESSVQQFEVALETLIQTAGKRKNRIRMQELSGEIASKEYETLLRQLKKEVRTKLAGLVYFQGILPVYQSLNQNIEQILQINKEQAQQRMYPREEFLRLQTLKLELTKEVFDLKQDKQELLSDLLQYIQLSPRENLYIISDENSAIQERFLNINLADLSSLDTRPDIQHFELQKKQAETAIKLAKSEAYPDFTLEASYNRFDGMWKDYIGFGVSFDLPIFNRNQGEI